MVSVGEFAALEGSDCARAASPNSRPFTTPAGTIDKRHPTGPKAPPMEYFKRSTQRTASVE
jgi:hypothetical protein